MVELLTVVLVIGILTAMLGVMVGFTMLALLLLAQAGGQ
jgi:hypothetical protein